jgi:hypothetical protein
VNQVIPTIPVLLAALAAAPAPPAIKAPDCPTLVRWDARTGKKTTVEKGREEPLPGGPLHLSVGWCLEVRGISTGLQSVTFDESGYDTTGVEALELLAEKLRPVTPPSLRSLPKGLIAAKDRIAAMLDGLRGVRGNDEASRLRDALRAALEEVRLLAEGPRGIQATRVQALLALDQMAAAPERSEEIAAELRDRFADRLTCEPGVEPCRTALAARVTLAEAFRRLERAREDLERVPRPKGDSEEDRAAAQAIDALLDSALAWLVEYPELSSAAREAEQVARLAVEARSAVVYGPVQARLGRGVVVRAVVEPRPEPDIASLAPRSTTGTEVRVERDNAFRLTVAPIGLWVAGPKRYMYGTVNGKVAMTGTSDVSLQVGVAVAFLSLPISSHHPVFLQVPDLIVVPVGSGAPGGGIGLSLAMGPVKLGAAALWLREDHLADQRIGDPVASGDTVRVNHGYPLRPRFALMAGGNL